MRSHADPYPHPALRWAFAGYRFPPEVITLAVRWYLRFGLSYRDVEELLAEREIEVDHVTIYRWVQRFAPEFVEAARARQHLVGDRWHVDETYLKVGGTWRYQSAAACPGTGEPPMGERDMAWPVARPAEEVGVLTMATSERAAPKDRPPLFLEGGIKSVGVRVAE
jgi:hypothetical protein